MGATIAYGAWFYWIAGIAAASLVAGAVLYLLGQRSERAGQLEASPGPG